MINMSIIHNTSDKKMLEIVVFGSSYPPNEFQLRKDIKNYEDSKDFSYIKALYSKRRFLKDYFRFFNPILIIK